MGYGYDANGNRITKSWTGGFSITYTYDDENQLVSMATDTWYTPVSSRWRTDLVYDGRGRLRVRKEYTWLSGYGWYLTTETRYVYDGVLVLQERSEGVRPGIRGDELTNW